ncbi:MAG: hypothetical protein ACLUFI_07900 [Oscillospiraceae bacterium]
MQRRDSQRGSGLDRNSELIVRRDLGVLPPEELTQRCKALGAELRPPTRTSAHALDFAPRYPMWLEDLVRGRGISRLGRRLLLDESASALPDHRRRRHRRLLILDHLTRHKPLTV